MKPRTQDQWLEIVRAAYQDGYKDGAEDYCGPPSDTTEQRISDTAELNATDYLLELEKNS